MAKIDQTVPFIQLSPSSRLKSQVGRNLIAIVGLCLVLSLYALSLSLINAQIKEILEVFIYAYFTISLFRFIFFMVGEVITPKENLDRIDKKEPLVSIILPAFNEEKMISSVLENFKYLNYSQFEVLVIDDGSSDQTFRVASRKSFDLPFKVRVFRKANGGKASALNYGIENAEGEFVLCMDADTTLSRDSLKRSIHEFSDHNKLGALAGVVRIAELTTWLNCFQHLDYLLGHFQRKTLSYFGKVTIIPGPIGLFRKKALLSIGGYEKEDTTFAEDAELTLRLLSAGWEIKSRDDMISYTEGPQNLNQLIRQRYRWSRGLYQALFKNMKALVFSYQDSNLLVLLYMIWEQIVLPILDFSILISLICYFVFGLSFEALSTLYSMILGIDIVTAILACRKEKNIIFWSVISVVARFTYANLLLVWKLGALYDEWKERAMNWDKIERRGSIFIENKEVRV